MTVDIHGHLDGAMAELFFDVNRAYAFAEQ
jgi:hypothetical protein